MSDLNKLLAKWRRDPVASIGEVLIDPETRKAFELYPARERFLREALTPKADGRLRFPDSRAPREDGKVRTATLQPQLSSCLRRLALRIVVAP
jgi:hypothetical protein